MAVITKEQLENASRDANDLETIVNGNPTVTVTTRLGQSVDSVSKAIEGIKAFNYRGNWATSTSYAIKDVVLESGIAYVAVVAHTSGVFATDLSSGNWVVHQGLTTQDLPDLVQADVFQSFGPASGGTDANVAVYPNTTSGSIYFGGTDATPQNDEEGFWNTITTILGRSPNPEDDLGLYSSSFGRNSIPFADYSYVFGHDSIAFGVASLAGGAGSATGDPAQPITGVASFLGYCAFAWGKGANAYGHASVAFGEQTKALVQGSVAMGRASIARGTVGSIALGNEASTSASGDWSLAIGQYVTSSGAGASNIGRGVNPGSPSSNAVANSLGLGINVLRPTVLFLSGSPGDAYTGKVVSRAGWGALGDVGAAIDVDFGGIYWTMVNGGAGGYAEPQIKGRRAGTVETYARFDGVAKYAQFYGDRLIAVGSKRTIPSATSTGVLGEICIDDNYIYVCTATNTWRRIAHVTW